MTLKSTNIPHVHLDERTFQIHFNTCGMVLTKMIEKQSKTVTAKQSRGNTHGNIHSIYIYMSLMGI